MDGVAVAKGGPERHPPDMRLAEEKQKMFVVGGRLRSTNKTI